MSPILRAIQSWWLISLLCLGCTSYREASLHQIESHPEQLTDKKVVVHYAMPGITSPDSLVALRVAEVRYPVLVGESFSDPKLYSNPEPIRPLQVPLAGTSRVEVLGFDAVKTTLLVAGIALVGLAIYAAM